MAMVHDREGTMEGELPVTRDLLNFMKGRHKAFAYATLDDSTGIMTLTGEAPWQDW
jgi:hypothetical protein